jgi:hypothetical protein
MEAFFILKYWHFLIAKIWHFKVADYTPLRGFTIMVQVEGRAMPVLRLLKAYGLSDISLVKLK